MKFFRKEALVNQKQMIVGGVVLLLLLVLGTVALRNSSRGPADPVRATSTFPVTGLVYCNGEEVKPCVVSFAIDVDGNMLVNLLLPDLTFPGFYLKITRGDNENTYKCRRVSEAPNSAYCTGEKQPPGEILHLRLLATRNDALLSEGDLSIIGLAFPTLPLSTLTPTVSPTAQLTASPTQTPTVRPGVPTPTRTKPSDPNPSPSYPNPSPSYP
ncbi:MAG: hypothetical protein C3F07_19865 [Anaerolineales bacterium]|nr:MAG: hypothetical protein C3F07_19865 [Anaerolineales bacterium]